ncbi:MAG TPA: polysaccharide biosynthesis/export family protein [Terriglobales bacterium]|nr:polysaccharide biosynthesis/export family protein [Terriglobales bacterium]
MKALVQYALFVVAGLLTPQLVLVAPAQEIVPPKADVAARGTASNTAKAGSSGDPALGGERYPLYRLTRSDTLDLSFTFSPEFNQTLTIQPDGFVSLRGAGSVRAEGLTIPEFQRSVIQTYIPFLHLPEITITLKDFERPYFLASGEVARPGKYELRGDLTVNEGVAIAGGFTQQALHSQVILFRRISSGVAESHVIDVKKMLNSRNLSEDWHLRPGDFVYVPQSRISKIRRFVPASSMNWYMNPLQF